MCASHYKSLMTIIWSALKRRAYMCGAFVKENPSRVLCARCVCAICKNNKLKATAWLGSLYLRWWVFLCTLYSWLYVAPAHSNSFLQGALDPNFGRKQFSLSSNGAVIIISNSQSMHTGSCNVWRRVEKSNFKNRNAAAFVLKVYKPGIKLGFSI